MKSIWTIYKRELYSYFTQPTAYAILFIFVILSMLLAFTFGAFFAAGDANLEWTFLIFHPILFALLAPATAMRLWADESRNGTIELLGTFPITTWSSIMGKYLASITVWLAALLLTFPIIITVNYLGEPDNGRIISGYLGSYLSCCVFLAITMFISSCTRDQVICLIISVTVCTFMLICSHDAIVRELLKYRFDRLVEALTSLGLWDHFRSLTRGLFRYQDMVWFASVIGTCLIGTSAMLSAKRA